MSQSLEKKNCSCWKISNSYERRVTNSDNNPKDKYAVCVKKNECIVGHLPLGKTGNFAKTIFHLLRVNKYSICEVEIAGKPVNLDDGEGMQVPCKLKLTERRKFVNILQIP